jgi:HD-GYP domain-containing protein (c-di-GMP phosphodiesterase class II)
VFDLGPPSELDEEEREKAKEAAKRTYAQSVSVTKDVINSVRMGKSPNIRKIKRVVQGIVDQILNEESSLMGLTTLRDYDEYTFTHSVNVCIFSVALGRKLGLTRLQLYELGVGALMHDVGKSRVPLEVLNKPDGLSEAEWQMMCAHPWLGVLTLYQMRGQHDVPYRAMIVAFEHHKKVDLSGYPKHVRPRTISMFSRIVAVADAFDAATTRRAYQTTPFTPADVLQELRRNPHRGMDQVVVKAFMSLVGHYPVGTLLVLDTFELAVVHAVNPLPEAVSRPLVKIVSDPMGNVLFPGHVVDLNEQAPGAGGYVRTIIKVADPDRYGINVSDYFV